MSFGDSQWLTNMLAKKPRRRLKRSIDLDASSPVSAKLTLSVGTRKGIMNSRIDL